VRIGAQWGVREAKAVYSHTPVSLGWGGSENIFPSPTGIPRLTRLPFLTAKNESKRALYILVRIVAPTFEIYRSPEAPGTWDLY
jgi:hypothetical protein